jgi:hypothetical protein
MTEYTPSMFPRFRAFCSPMGAPVLHVVLVRRWLLNRPKLSRPAEANIAASSRVIPCSIEPKHATSCSGAA